MSEGDNSYMAMLNNPVINPGPAAPNVTAKKENTRLKPSSIPLVQKAKTKLISVTKDLYLSSESDEPFEWINTSTDHQELPNTVAELVELGLVDEEEQVGNLKIKSLEEFFKQNEYKEIIKAFKEIQQGDSKVYLLGEESITVLILCIIQDKQSSNAIVGLKSLLVQT